MKISLRPLAGSRWPGALWIGALLAGLLAVPGTASAQSSCPAPEARQFDFWFGEWVTENSQRSPTDVENPAWNPTGPARSVVWSALGGCAVVELWRGDLVWADQEGFSVRAYDPETGRWHLVLHWPSSIRPRTSFSTLAGGFEHGRGEFFTERQRPDGPPIIARFTFSDIAADRFRWDQAFSVDDGNRWRPSWIMRISRVAPGDELGLVHFADATPEAVAEGSLCGETEARLLDGLLGDWRTDGGMLSVRSILRGCAQMLTLETAANGGDRFWVRAYDAAEERWVQYALAEGEPVFERLEGGFDDDGWSVSGDGGSELWWWEDGVLQVTRGEGEAQRFEKVGGG